MILGPGAQLGAAVIAGTSKHAVDFNGGCRRIYYYYHYSSYLWYYCCYICSKYIHKASSGLPSPSGSRAG